MTAAGPQWLIPEWVAERHNVEVTELAIAEDELEAGEVARVYGLGFRRVEPTSTVTLPSPRGPRPELTERQVEVLELMVEGLSNPEIGRRLRLTESTVKVHVKGVMRKLGTRDRAHTVAVAFQHGLVV